MRKLLLSLALLVAGAMTIGAVTVPETGVYTIQGGVTGQHRGFLVAGKNITTHPVLAEIGWSTYAGNSTEAIDGGKNWYVKSAGNDQFYIYNLALEKFIAVGTGSVINFSDTPYLWKIVVNSSDSNYNSIRDTNGTTYLCFACGKTGANRPVHFNNEAADGGSMHTFTAVGNGETTYAESIEEANSVIEKFGEISYTLTDEGGNVYKGSYVGVRGTTMPTFTGAAGYTLTDPVWDGNNLTATINFPVTVSSAEKTNGTTLTIFNDQKFLRADGTNIKVQTTGVKALDLAAMWAIYPSFENGKFTFTIKNLSTGKYIHSTATAASHNSEGTVILSETASKFVITGDRDFCFDGKTLYLSINSAGDTNVWLGVYGGQHGGTNIYTPTTYGTEANPYLINNVNDLVLFRNSVNAGETSFSAPGVHVALGADIDLAGQNWVGIGSMNAEHGFMGNFDGNGKTIKNLTIDNPALIGGAAYAGLFGLTEGVDENNQNYVKDLTIENVTINTTGQIAAAAIAYAYYTIVEKVTVCGNISIKGGDYTAGVLAYTRRCVNASNITVAGNAGSTITGATTVGGVISDIQTNDGLVADYSNFSVSNVTITGVKSVGGISGIISGQTLNGASVKNVTLVSGDDLAGVVAGRLGDASTISNVVTEEVTGATAIVGATYKDASPVEILEHNGVYTIKSQFISGEGTEANPYLIKSVEELVFFRNSVNAGETKYNAPGVYVALGANIDLAGENWTPIGNADYNDKYQPVDASKVFSGVFDGKGKVISNLNVSKYVGGVDEEANLGLFAITGAGAVIKDLTLTNVNIETDGRNVGALAGFAYMATLSNITVNGDIQIKGGNNVAGVAAMTRHYAMSATNISVSGADGSAIVGNNIVGGIFAEIAPNGSTQKFDGLNVENVAITGAGGVGGIVGLLTTGAVENVSVKDVVLTGRTDYQGNAMGRIRLGSVAGLMGGKYATIANEVVENVTAKNLNGDDIEQLPVIGANYDASSNATEAKIGNTYYATFEAAMAAQGNDNVELLVEKYITLDDTKAYTYTKGAADLSVEYTRTLIPGIWNPVYIPFDATVPADEFEVAEFTSAEGTTVTLTKLDANEGGEEIDLSAKTAYVVRPIDGNNTLSLDAWGYIYSNEVASPQELGEGFSVRGNYNVLTGDKLAATDRIVSKDGKWAKLAGTSTLKPYRLILSVPESFSAEQNAISFSMRVLDNTTGVEETIMDGQEALVIYDLMGRRVETMTEGGIYIVNGKKIVF